MESNGAQECTFHLALETRNGINGKYIHPVCPLGRLELGGIVFVWAPLISRGTKPPVSFSTQSKAIGQRFGCVRIPITLVKGDRFKGTGDDLWMYDKGPFT